MKTLQAIDLKLLKKAVDASASSIVITDAGQQGMPLIFVNRAFERITGYSAAESLGRNCRFLQGSDSKQPGIRVIRDAIRRRKSCQVLLHNYRKDGTLFCNELFLSPVFGADGLLTHYIGVQTEVTARVKAEEALEKYKVELEQRVREQTASLEQKNIADFLSISPKTVENQRNGIRKKLGILRKNVNLPSFLKTI
jgi:PAS domain S-box-containing protein